ncbi:MAG: ABC transporter permease [Deltaproteobacteria bacterium]
MIIRANIKEALKSLMSAKQRTLLALIGIVIGIGSVIAMVSVGHIVQVESLRQFKEMGTDLISIEKDDGSDSSSPGIGGARATKSSIKLADVLGMTAGCSAITVVAPSVNVSGQASYGGKNIPNSRLMGVTESFRDINKLRISQGGFISDLDAQSQFCVIGSNVATAIRKQGCGNIIGEKLKVGEKVYTIVGVTENVPESGMRNFSPNDALCVHISTALRSSKGSGISNIIARVSAGTTNNIAREQVMAYFKSKNSTLSLKVSSPEEIIAQMEKQMRMITLLMGAVGSISLIVGGVGVMNVMLVSVSERRREIGIRRALGAKRGDISGQFLIESVILSMMGGTLGILLGVGASYLVSLFAHWNFLFSFKAILLGVGVSNVVGIFSGYYPARQASMMDPIVALKSD